MTNMWGRALDAWAARLSSTAVNLLSKICFSYILNKLILKLGGKFCVSWFFPKNKFLFTPYLILSNTISFTGLHFSTSLLQSTYNFPFWYGTHYRCWTYFDQFGSILFMPDEEKQVVAINNAWKFLSFHSMILTKVINIYFNNITVI